MGAPVILPVIAVLLLVGVAALGFLWSRERRRAQTLAGLTHVLAGHADVANTPFELLQQAGGQWVQLAKGGDVSAGIFANMNSCPCRMTYTVATNIFPINAWPNPKPNPVAGFPWNAPPRQREPWPCPGACVIVPIKIWRGWMVMQGPQGQLQVNIHTFTQYHCKEPTDPDINKPPEGWELPPRPPEPEKPDVET